MSKHVSREKSQNKWDESIAAAKVILQRVEARAQRLRTDIRVMQESRDAGEQWPIKEAGTDAASIPA